VRNSGLRLQVTLLGTGTVAREEFKCSPLFGVRCSFPPLSTAQLSTPQLLFSLSAFPERLVFTTEHTENTEAAHLRFSDLTL